MSSGRPLRLTPIEAITAEDLARLAWDGVPEDQHLEYKRDLWATTRDGSKELLKDVSAFVNADGGDLIVGIGEREDAPHELVGVDVDDRDEILRGLLSKLAVGLEPSVSNLRARWIPLDNGQQALLLRVPSRRSAVMGSRDPGF